MIEPIFERIYSYKKILFAHVKRLSTEAIKYSKKLNIYLQLKIKGIRYKYNLKREYYVLGKYLSSLEGTKYNLSEDTIFHEHIKKIKIEKELIKENKNDLSLLFNEDG